jgi:hypothetical protein
MIKAFYENWECWFVGSFEPDVSAASLKSIKSFMVNRFLSQLKKPVTFRFVGPGANQFVNNGSMALPASLRGCHVMVLLDPCPADLREQAMRLARAEHVPVFNGLDERLLLESYFIPGAWNSARHS